MNPCDYYNVGKLYGEFSNVFSDLLTLKPSEIETDVFMCRIYKHVETSINSGITVPSFGEGDWLNTSRPLDYDYDLKNRIYVIDFFTLCCVKCIHILDILKQVESRYKQTENFTVIGVHSPKFRSEKELERVKEAVRKHEINHPVFNDQDRKVYNSFGVYCWPTVFIIGPGHTVLFTLVGEDEIDKLPFLCEHILEYCSLSFSDYPVCELPISPLDERASEEASVENSLLFPGSISTDGNILAVSDTGHNRILLMSKDLKIQETIGSGLRGNKDGTFEIATFNSPNGSTWYNGKLYVADTGNHCIREINIDFNFVTTVFSDKDVNEKFQSPWDVCMGPMLGTDFNQLRMLYIAVAGSHQIWAANLDPTSAVCIGVFAGSGMEENCRNSYRLKAGFAQPSGIAYSSLSPDHIYVADSGNSAVKSIDLRNNGSVQIIFGGGRDPTDLFQFGDMDGNRLECKLQHPMGVAVIGKHLLAITDTYNHKVKIVDTFKNECNTLDQPIQLREPSGLCFMDSEFSNIPSRKLLYVCDTNNHQIVPIQIYESMLSSEQVQCNSQGPLTVIQSFNTESALHMDITELVLDYDGIINCRFKWNFSENIKMNVEGSNCNFEHQGEGLFKVEFLCPGGAFEGHNGIDPTLRLTSSKKYLEEKRSENPKSSVKITCHVAYCDENSGVCRFFDATFEFLIKFVQCSKSSSKVVELFLEAYSA